MFGGSLIRIKSCNNDLFISRASGSNHLYVLINPIKKDASADLPKDISWEFAQKEIAQAKGFATGSGDGLSKGNAATCGGLLSGTNKGCL